MIMHTSVLILVLHCLFLPDAPEAIWHLCCVFLPDTSEAIWHLCCVFLPDACEAIWLVLFYFRLTPLRLYGIDVVCVA